MDRFAIFRGLPKMMPFQLGVTADLARAVDLMTRMNARIPGDYFIRDLVTQDIVNEVRATSAEIADGLRPGPEHADLFDIFCGNAGKNAMWYETVGGLSNARTRMEQIAQRCPGAYFLFSRRDRSVLARIDTTEKASEWVRVDSVVA